MCQAHKNDSLRVVVAYHRLPVPARGETVQFQPLEHLSPISFTRGGKAIPSLVNEVVDLKACKSNLELVEVISCYFTMCCNIGMCKCCTILIIQPSSYSIFQNNNLW